MTRFSRKRDLLSKNYAKNASARESKTTLLAPTKTIRRPCTSSTMTPLELRLTNQRR
jgi:hypothetical protein